jgi:SAM-dependent methyltransferase
MPPLNGKTSLERYGYIGAQYEHDRHQTLGHRRRLLENANLREWYRGLYIHQFRDLPGGVGGKRILEIGSGASPLKWFYPQVITSDVLSLEHVDLVFDGHHIDQVAAISDHSLDAISLTNVLHHLQRPVEFLSKAASKLASGAVLIATEPYLSLVSTPIFRLLHHEPVRWRITAPVLEDIAGPLASANIALPQRLFFGPPVWSEPLWTNYCRTKFSVRYFSSLAYMLTGGMSLHLPLPRMLYRRILKIDVALSQAFPRLTASFFTVTLVKN